MPVHHIKIQINKVTIESDKILNHFTIHKIHIDTNCIKYEYVNNFIFNIM